MKSALSSQLTCRRSFLGALAFGMLAALCGCDTTGPFMNPDAPHFTEPPAQIAAMWQPNVMYTQDSLHDGKTCPVIAGRVYLFGSEPAHPLIGNGGSGRRTLRHDAATWPNRASQARGLALDPESLNKLLRHDFIGWGYTVVLPWSSSRPDILSVQMKIRYQCTGFKLTDDSLASLRGAGVPEPLLAKLSTLKDKDFDTQGQFESKLTPMLTECEGLERSTVVHTAANNVAPLSYADRYRNMILHTAERARGPALYSESGPLTLAATPQNGFQPVQRASMQTRGN